ncbi:MAG: hypothetical protein R3303_13975 [Marinobacter sp.]|nr:hypothetical protein [Marinobacter sp.]
MKDVNKNLTVNPKSLVPLVGFGALEHGFKFQINMHQFGGMRCHAVISVDCLAACMEAVGVGQCQLLIHEAIYEQAHFNQVQLRWMDESDLPVLIEVFSKYWVEWVHFDD